MTMHERFKELQHDVCNCVRWKSLFYQAEPDPSVPPAYDNSYWCAMTQSVLGPDGQVVEPENCRPERGCFKEPF
jgi:hypothetical protein